MTLVEQSSEVLAVPHQPPAPIVERSPEGARDTYCEQVISTVVEAAIERERKALPVTVRVSGRRKAAFERKSSDLRRLVRGMHYRIGELSMSDPDAIGVSLPGFLDELQEDCYGEFIALSRGESKLVLSTMLFDFGVRLSMEDVAKFSTYDADPDFIAFNKKQKNSKTIDGILAGTVAGILTAMIIMVVPPFFGFDLSIPQFEINVVEGKP